MSTDAPTFARIAGVHAPLARAIARTAPAFRRSIAHVATQHGRPTAATLHRAWSHPGPAPGSGSVARSPSGTSGGTPFHMRVTSQHDAAAAARHQAYLERDVACIDSFGTIHDDYDARRDLWTDLARHLPGARRGWIEADRVTAPSCAAALARQDSRHLRHHGSLIRYTAPDTAAYRAAKNAILDAADTHGIVARTLPGRRDSERVPPGVRARKPRATIVQKRIIGALPHELSPDVHAAFLRRWCDRWFRPDGIPYHCVIHRPEAGNDPRNWHSHIVLPTVLPKRNGAGWIPVRKPNGRPLVPALMRTLSANGPGGPAAQSRLIRNFRSTWADGLNDRLLHLSLPPRLHAGRASGGHRSRHLPAAHQADHRDHTARSRADHALRWSVLPDDLPHQDARLLSGLAAYGHAPGNAVWDATARAIRARATGSPDAGDDPDIPLPDPALRDHIARLLAEQHRDGDRWARRWRDRQRGLSDPYRLGAAARDATTEAGGPRPVELMRERGLPEAREVHDLVAEHRRLIQPWRIIWGKARRRRPRDTAATADARYAAYANRLTSHGVDHPGLVLPPADAAIVDEALVRHLARARTGLLDTDPGQTASPDPAAHPPASAEPNPPATLDEWRAHWSQQAPYLHRPAPAGPDPDTDIPAPGVPADLRDQIAAAGAIDDPHDRFHALAHVTDPATVARLRARPATAALVEPVARAHVYERQRRQELERRITGILDRPGPAAARQADRILQDPASRKRLDRRHLADLRRATRHPATLDVPAREHGPVPSRDPPH